MRLFTLLFSLLLLPLASEARLLSTATTAIDVQVFENTTSEKPFSVIGKIVVKASRVEDLKKEIARVARRKGGDAVLGFKIVNYGAPEIGAVTSPQGQVLYGLGTLPTAMAEGIVVEFVRTGGILQIDEGTDVPILD